jgi:transposase
VKVSPMNDFTLFLPDAAKLILQQVKIDPETHQVVLTIATSQRDCACPKCQAVSHRVHSHYPRQIADLPWSDYNVQLQLQSRKLFCDNPACAQKGFTERLPTIVVPWGRCTVRLNRWLGQIGVFVGGQAGAKLSGDCHCQRSRNTLIRRVRRLPLPPVPPLKTVGLDEFAWRKGHTYGTIVVDLERHRPIALLADREVDTIVQWLQTHPEIKILSRDRSRLYRKAMNQGAPQAIQVADRFHLLHNLVESLEALMQTQEESIRAAQVTLATNTANPNGKPASTAIVPVLGQMDSQPPSVYVQQRQAQHQTVRDLYYQQNWSSEAIAQHLGISQRTVYRDLNRPNYIPPPNRKPRRVRSLLTQHQDFIVQYYQSAERPQTGLLKALRDRGYTGCERTLGRYVKELLQRGQIVRRLGIKDILAEVAPQPINLLTPREIAWLVMQRQSQQTHETQVLLQQLKIQSPELSSIIEFATEFLGMIRQRQSKLFEPWLARFEQSPMDLIKSFTAGLRDDFEAVKAAMETEVSNGPVEGLNNRLKMLKRQMYGRANVDLLEKRFILTSQDHPAA